MRYNLDYSFIYNNLQEITIFVFLVVVTYDCYNRWFRVRRDLEIDNMMERYIHLQMLRKRTNG